MIQGEKDTIDMAVHPESNDKDLWFAFQQGSTEALTAIYHRHIADLYNYGARITADRNVLEDSIQDLFLNFGNREPL